MIAIPQSVARRIVLKAYLSSDHVSAATGKTVAVVISKNGGAFANPSAGATNATEIANGWYYVDLSTTDIGTQGPLIVRGTASGIDDTESPPFFVVDAHNAGFDALPSAVAAATGGVPTVDASNAVKVQSGTGANQISLSSGTVTAGTVSDKTGYSLSAAGVQAVWDALTSALTTVGSIGKLIVTNLDATVSSRSTYAGTDTAGTTTLLSRLTGTRAANLDNLDATVSSRSSHTAADVWAATTRTLSSFGTLTADTATAVWSVLTTALTTVGSIGKLLATNIDATISSRSTYAGGDTAGITTLLSRLTGTRATNLDNLDAAISTRSTYAGADTAGTTTLLGRLTSGRATNLDNLDVAVSTRSSHSAADVWAVTTRTLSSFGTLVADGATAVWAAGSRTLTAFGFGVTVSDKTGYSLTTAYDPAKTAAQAGDAMTLTAAYDAAKTALAASSYTAPDNTSITAIKAKTDNLPASPAAVSDIPTATQNADALLKRDWTGLTGEASRSVLNALRFMRNKWSLSGTTMTVTKEDDTATAWTATVTTNATQDPISGADPS